MYKAIGGEIFLSLAPYFGEGIGIDQNPKMVKTAKHNAVTQLVDNVTFVQMEGANLQFAAEEFDAVLLRHLGCHILAQAEYEVPYWFLDRESCILYILSIPWPEEIVLEKHWQNINQILETYQTERGIETNEHQGLLIVQKLA